MKNIYLIIGPSGSGKTTISENLRDKYGYKLVESYTTRPPRYPGERGHIFVSDEEFDTLGEMCAYTEYNGYRYGVTREIVDESDIYVIDPPGVEYMYQNYHGNKGIVTIGLNVSETIRALRMMKRGDTIDQILKRIELDAKVFDKKKYGFLCSIELDELNLDEATERVKKYISIREQTSNYEKYFKALAQ